MMPAADLPRAALLVARLIPAADRAAILGDLVEDAHDRALCGARRTCWLLLECGAVAIGLTVERTRAACTLPPLREVAAGAVLDGTHALRAFGAPRTTLWHLAVFCASVATLAIVAEVLVGALLSAAGFGNP